MSHLQRALTKRPALELPLDGRVLNFEFSIFDFVAPGSEARWQTGNGSLARLEDRNHRGCPNTPPETNAMNAMNAMTIQN